MTEIVSRQSGGYLHFPRVAVRVKPFFLLHALQTLPLTARSRPAAFFQLPLSHIQLLSSRVRFLLKLQKINAVTLSLNRSMLSIN